MLVVYFIFSLFYFNSHSENNFHIKIKTLNSNLSACITDIAVKYFSDKIITFVDMSSGDDHILQTIHSSAVTSIVSKDIATQSSFRHQGYLITAKTAREFTEYFQNLLEDPGWNPTARFLIIISLLKEEDLKKVFYVLLKTHVINVLVVNGTDDAHLYTYNPYDNFACGKYYKDIISYGVCLQATNNLYPNKLVTGLRNCTFRASVPHRIPFGIDPSQPDVDKRLKLGIEQYLFKLLGETEHFEVNFTYGVDNTYSPINGKMKASGPLAKLQNNESDVMLGCVVLSEVRGDVFTYLHGYLDYHDDLRFFVKHAPNVPTWKYVYLEFSPTVWCLLLLVFFLYSTVVILLVRAEDKIEVILNLLGTLLSHSLKIPDRISVQCFLIIWVWFAYLVNSVYQSSLVSMTQHPPRQYQISNEYDIIEYNLTPCVAPGVFDSYKCKTWVPNANDNKCLNPVLNLKKVANSSNLFTLTQKSFFQYYKKFLCDKYGEPQVYYFSKAYNKYIYATFFYKGFPLTDSMRCNAIRLRETGLLEKVTRNHFYLQEIKYKFHEKGFEPLFVIPWFIHFVGCVLSTIVFIFELLSSVHYSNRLRKLFCRQTDKNK
uniref:SFRICE003514.2 n=1 Tax=Spodoptera frugiperda TaxID=7108 RepID=A0A2H1VMH4_SPOFR